MPRMKFTLTLTDTPFNLEQTLQSGQVFRWQNSGEWWYGVVPGGVLKVRQEIDSLQCDGSSELLDSSFVRNLFRLDEDLIGVLGTIPKDETMDHAWQRFYGMRLMRQDRWECLASFVLATNSNIPRIRLMISKVCERFGEHVSFEGRTHFTFPNPEKLADATVAELEDCGLGYRAPFLKHVATAVDQGKIDFSELTLIDYVDAREAMISRLFGEKLLQGVGPKVADCVLLFALGKNEAFPIDVWVARALNRYYPSLLSPNLKKRLASEQKASIGKADYDKTSESARAHFGPYAGYAQQYLFMLARDEEAK